MVSCAGLGGLVPNTVVMPYKESGMARLPQNYVERINSMLNAEEQAPAKKRSWFKGKRKPFADGVINNKGSQNSDLG